nr:ATP synthase F0 subunit 8 [Tachinidae sp.]
MPQMAPLSWLSLFIMFLITFMIFNMMNYYSFKSLTPKSNLTFLKVNNPFNWKW